MKRNEEGQSFIAGLGVLLVILFVMGAIVWLLGTYRIDTNEGGILTQFNGEKVTVTKVGWDSRMPLVTDLDKYSLAMQNIYFPSDYLQLEENFNPDAQSGSIGIDIKTTDDKVVDVGVVMPYRIVDLNQWGVMNQNPQQQFQKKFDALVFNYLQTQSSDKITSQIAATNNELYDIIKLSSIEKDFGVEVGRPELLRPTFTKIALDALSRKQALQAISEGELIAAQNRADATKTLADATEYQANKLRGVSPEFLQYSANIELYKVLSDKDRKDSTIYVPYGSDIVVR